MTYTYLSCNIYFMIKLTYIAAGARHDFYAQIPDTSVKVCIHLLKFSRNKINLIWAWGSVQA